MENVNRKKILIIIIVNKKVSIIVYTNDYLL